MLFRVGADYEGNNNPYNAPAFVIFDAGMRLNTHWNDVMFGVSAENISNVNWGAQLGSRRRVPRAPAGRRNAGGQRLHVLAVEQLQLGSRGAAPDDGPRNADENVLASARPQRAEKKRGAVARPSLFLILLAVSGVGSSV